MLVLVLEEALGVGGVGRERRGDGDVGGEEVSRCGCVGWLARRAIRSRVEIELPTSSTSRRV